MITLRAHPAWPRTVHRALRSRIALAGYRQGWSEIRNRVLPLGGLINTRKQRNYISKHCRFATVERDEVSRSFRAKGSSRTGRLARRIRHFVSSPRMAFRRPVLPVPERPW